LEAKLTEVDDTKGEAVAGTISDSEFNLQLIIIE